MGLCEVYADIECFGIDECPNDGECERLMCDRRNCEYWVPRDGICSYGNCCKKEMI